MNFTKNKKILALLTFALCFSMLLTGCAGDSSHAGENESQEHEAGQEEESTPTENFICSKFVLQTQIHYYHSLSSRKEIAEKVEYLLGFSELTGECRITMKYTYKFDPTVLEDKGYDVEYPEYEIRNYNATLVTTVDKIDYDMLYEYAADKGIRTVTIFYYSQFLFDE